MKKQIILSCSSKTEKKDRIQESGVRMKTYLYAAGQIMAQYDGDWGDEGTGKYFYLHDRLGSTRLIIDTAGDVKNRYTYNPFGELFTSEVEKPQNKCSRPAS